MHKKSLKCEAKNDVSSQTASYLIEVSRKKNNHSFFYDQILKILASFNLFKDGPRFIKELPSHQMVRLSENVHLKCEVESNPGSLIFWTLNGTNIYAYPTLTISNFQKENYGTYGLLWTRRHC